MHGVFRLFFQLQIILAFSLLTLISGCGSQFSLRDEHRVNAILDAYKAQNERVQSNRYTGVHKFSVTLGAPPLDSVVTVDLTDAPLSTIITRILTVSKVENAFDATLLSGRVSAKFKELKVIQALNILLRHQGLHAAAHGSVVTIDRGISLAEAETSPLDASGLTEVPIYHGNPEAIASMLGNFYGNEESGQIQYALNIDKKSVLLKGEPRKVSQAVDLIRRAGREPAHVIIESLVVEFDVAAYEKLGADILEGQTGRLSGVTTDIGVKEFPALRFTWAKAAQNPVQFQAIIEALVSQNEARVVARPYVSTMSGNQAVIDIALDRHVIIKVFQGVAAESNSTETEAITSGVKLEITPVVLTGGRIQADVHVEASSFLPPPKDVLLELKRNSVKSSLEVESGQTVIVAGLTRNNETRGTAGFPGLRHVPILNLWFDWKEHESQRTNVVIFVTPWIWEPGMNLPLVVPNALTAPDVTRVKASRDESEASR